MMPGRGSCCLVVATEDKHRRGDFGGFASRYTSDTAVEKVFQPEPGWRRVGRRASATGRTTSMCRVFLEIGARRANGENECNEYEESGDAIVYQPHLCDLCLASYRLYSCKRNATWRMLPACFTRHNLPLPLSGISCPPWNS